MANYYRLSANQFLFGQHAIASMRRFRSLAIQYAGFPGLQVEAI